MAYKFNPFTGNLDLVETGGGGTPGGSDTQVQFNDGGAFGGDSGLTFDKTTNALTVGASTGDGGSAQIFGDITLDDGGVNTTTLQMITPTTDRTISFPDASGTVALVAGSSGQVTYNSSGVQAGDSGLTYDDAAGALTVGGKTVTTDAPIINLSQTWNNAATTFTGLKLNVTNTASAAASNLLDLQVGGTSSFSVSQNGSISGATLKINGIGANDPGGIGIGTSQSNVLAGYISSGNVAWVSSVFGIGFILPSDAGPIGFSSAGRTSVSSVASSKDTLLYRDAAGILAQRNGTNAQTFRLYNTYTDASNFERTSITRDSSGLVIDAQKGGTGADPTNLLDLQLDGASKLKFDKFGINYGVASAITNYIAIGGAYGATNGFRLYGDTGTLRFASNHTVGWTANATESFTTLDTALTRDSAGVVKITDGSTGTGYLKLIPTTVGALTAAATVGAGTKAFVTDSTSTLSSHHGQVVVGGGTNFVPVFSDGTNWIVG